MSSNSTHEFPSPAGGIPLPIDFWPGIIFSIAHAALIPIAVWRLISPRSRTYVMIGTCLYMVERVVAYVLRAAVSHNVSLRGNVTLEVYLQTTLAGGFVSMGQDLTGLVRALLVSTTVGSRMRDHIKLTPQHFDPALARGLSHAPSDAIRLKEARGSTEALGAGEDAGEFFEDYPERREQIRGYTGVGQLAFLAATILGIIAGIDYQGAAQSGAHAQLVRTLWYVSNGLALGLLIAFACGSIYAYYKLPRVPRNSVVIIVIIAGLLSIVASYRLAILRYSTTSITSTAPGSLNAPSSKIAFYLLHVVPEFTAAAILMCTNVRRTFATGDHGDRKGKDPKLGPDGKPVPKSGKGWWARLTSWRWK